MSNRYFMHVVSHTHWDREWYLSFQQYRLRLVDLVDHLLEILDRDKEYKYFTLDGQTVVLDDYFEIKPQNKKRLQEYVKKGRVFVGPWYILPDEFLVSGEATIRNLMLGHRKAEDMGAVMKIGYIPDPFGHITQMPQILQGFGIDNFIFTRGMGKVPKSEFWWESPDGSRVLTILQRDGYCHGNSISDEPKEAIARFDEFYNNLAHLTTTPHILINNGCDHLEPQPTLPTILKNVRKEWKKAEIIHSNFPEFILNVKQAKPKLETVRGELRDCTIHYLLYGVYSARMYLKQLNERGQTALEKYAEPLSAFAWLTGETYPAEALWHSWTWLIKNHPHDSICGCSIDAVHEQMLTRFAWSKEIADDLTNRAISQIGEKIDTEVLDTKDVGLVLFNTLNWERNEVVQTFVDFPKDSRTKGVRIFDMDGKELPCQVMAVCDDLQKVYHGHRMPEFHPCTRVQIAFPTEAIPACGYKTFKVTPYQIAKESPGKPIGWANVLENEFIKVEVETDGTFILYDKKTKKRYNECHVFEDGADAGDEYNYSPCVEDMVFHCRLLNASFQNITRGPLMATIKIAGEIVLPKRLTKDRKHRSNEMVTCPVTTYITVTKGSPRVDIVTEFENKAEDHRLRVLFPTGIKTDYSHAEGQFDVVKRSVKVPDSKDYKIELPPSTHPQQSFVDVNDGKVGLTIINQGLPEYELKDDAERTIALTLLRCVGWLSREDLLTRFANAGPSFATPGAQCLGRHIFRYAVMPHKGTWADAKVYQWAHQHNVELKRYQTKKHEGKLPSQYGFFSVTPASLVVTAVKKSDKNNSLILRTYNISNNKVIGKIEFSKDVRSVYLTNLNEETKEKLPVKNQRSAQVTVLPKQIVTLSVVMA